MAAHSDLQTTLELDDATQETLGNFLAWVTNYNQYIANAWDENAHKHDDVDKEGVEEFIDTVCHEMIHVKQHATKKVIDRIRGGYKKLWKCRDGKYRNYLETAYDKQPWEIEAHRDSGKYMRDFKKEFYGY